MKKTALGAFAVFAVLSAIGADGDWMAETASATVFRLNTHAAPAYTLPSKHVLDAFGAVTWRAGETVTVTQPDGTTRVLVSEAETAGSVVIPFDAGGVWQLCNSMQGTVRIGVPWTVFGDGGKLGEATARLSFLDTEASGPNRRTVRGVARAVAYSGDQWLGEIGAASVLTVTAPDGTAQTMECLGTGTQAFCPHLRGLWTVTLAAGDSVRTSEISVFDAGTMMLVR